MRCFVAPSQSNSDWVIRDTWNRRKELSNWQHNKLSVNYLMFFFNPLYSFSSDFKSDKSLRPSASFFLFLIFFILEGAGGGVGMKGSSTAQADFFVARAKLFYDDVLFGNSVLIRRAIYCSLIDLLTICDGPFISTDIILLFCCLFVCTFFICRSSPVVT